MPQPLPDTRLLNACSDATLMQLSARLPAPDKAGIEAARARLDLLTKPRGALGRLEDLVVFLAGWQGTDRPSATRAHTLLFAGNHGVTAQGVSAYPPAVTAQMVANFERGGAAINQLCDAIPSTLKVVPLALETPTADFTQTPAMTADECASAFRTGAQSVPEKADILILGEMGIGNTTVAAALAHAVGGGEAKDWTGNGTGIAPETLRRKTDAVARAVALHRPAVHGGVTLLQHLGGRELAALAGAIACARLRCIPVLLDGYVVTAAASALWYSHPSWLDHAIAGHCSAEPGHARLLSHLGLSPLLSLEMRLGEGSGAQLALGIVHAALAAYHGMATFDEAAVSTREQAA